jgi:uncharacterized UPF0160 family protein
MSNYLDNKHRTMKPMATLANIMREFSPEVDANHHHQEGYRQAMNEAIELINRPDLKNRREIIAALETRRDIAISADNSAAGR